MKLIITIIMLTTGLTFANELPSDYIYLKEIRSKAMKNIEKKYVVALRKLKLKYVKKGDLQMALRIDSEIALVTNQINQVEIQKKKTKDFTITGIWEVIDGSRWTRRRTRKFNNTHLIDRYGNRHRMKIKEDTVIVTWKFGGWERLQIDKRTPNIMIGTNNSNERFIYKRKKE